MHKVECDRARPEVMHDTPGTVGSGYNSGFQLLNLVVQFGARRIILVGYDYRLGDRAETHWHGNHGRGLNNPSAKSMLRWVQVLEAQVDWLKARGVEVVNASPRSAITAFPRKTVEQALEEWCP